MKAQQAKKLLKKNFPSLGLFSSVVFLDPEYDIPDHNQFVDDYNHIWWAELTELKEKAIRLGWQGVQCEDFALMSVSEIRKRRLQRETTEYFPWLMGRMVGEYRGLSGWKAHSWGFVVTSNGVYCLNYENITNNFDRFKPQRVTA